MFVRTSCPTRLSRFLTRFLRADRGVTAVEFALISLPLMLMTFGLLELGLVFLVSATLDTAVETSAREIRTGEFQTSAANTRADFKNLVCSKMTWLQGQCAANLWLDVRTFATFSALAANPPVNPATFNPAAPGATCFTAGNPTDIVLVRAYFQWTLFTPVLNSALANTGSTQRLLTSTTAFRNEPYNTSPPIGTSC
jgi:Flp pilus assembly protein TadG